MAGRKSITENLILEPKKHTLDLNKCLFVIISVTPIKGDLNDRSGKDEVELPTDLIDISDLIELLTDEPLNISEDKIKVYVNPNEAEKIYYELSSSTRKGDIENIVIFYQGFGYIFDNRLLLLLDPTFDDNPSKYLKISEIAEIIQPKKDLNVIMFLDCSYSARAFDEIKNDNFVVIASSDKNQHAYFKYDKNTKKHSSVFSSALIETIKNAIKKGQENFSLSELYLKVRTEVIKSAKSVGKETDQLPIISTRNLTQFYKFINTAKNKSTPQQNFEVSRTILNEEKMLTDNKFYETLRKLIANDKTSRAITILYTEKNNFDEGEKNEIITQVSRYKHLSRTKRLGMITNEEFDVQSLVFKQALLELINELEDYYPDLKL